MNPRARKVPTNLDFQFSGLMWLILVAPRGPTWPRQGSLPPWCSCGGAWKRSTCPRYSLALGSRSAPRESPRPLRWASGDLLGRSCALALPVPRCTARIITVVLQHMHDATIDHSRRLQQPSFGPNWPSANGTAMAMTRASMAPMSCTSHICGPKLRTNKSMNRTNCWMISWVHHQPIKQYIHPSAIVFLHFLPFASYIGSVKALTHRVAPQACSHAAGVSWRKQPTISCCKSVVSTIQWRTRPIRG